MGNCHPSKTNVHLVFASFDIGFMGVTISNVTLSWFSQGDNIQCSQFLYDNVLLMMYLYLLFKLQSKKGQHDICRLG